MSPSGVAVAEQAPEPAAIRVSVARPTFSWAAGFLLVFLLLASWSLATPNYAAPDEPAHTFRAASLVRGQLLGSPAPAAAAPRLLVQVPATLAAYAPGCFAFRQIIPASCEPAWTARPGLRTVRTYTGRYPPLYYLTVGLPSLFVHSGSVLLWMRLAGDLVNALFLTAGLKLLGRLRSLWPMVGATVALTPMVVFMASVINPSGLEICAAFALWSALLAMVFSRDQQGRASSMAWATASAVVFESTRGLSPALMAGTVAAVALFAGRRRLTVLLRTPRLRAAGLVVGAFGVLAAAWTLTAGALRLAPVTPIKASVTRTRLLDIVVVKDSRPQQLIGVFGWLDTPAPGWVFTAWVVAALLLVAGAAAHRAWRQLAVVVLVVLACFVISAGGDLLKARTLGLVSEGRYILPVAVGIPLLAAGTIRWRHRPARLGGHVLVVALLAGQAATFVHTLQRYRVGIPERLPLRHGEWSPPLGAALLTAVCVLALGGLYLWASMLVGSPVLGRRLPSAAATG